MTADGREDEELRRGRDQLRLALRAARMGVWDWDVATGRLTWSEGLEEIHGMAPGSFDGTLEGFLAVVHPDDRGPVRDGIGAALETGGDFSIEFRAVGHDGVTRWVAGEGRAEHDADGRPVRMLGVGRDVTHDHRVAEALRESEARFRAMADSAPVLIRVADATGGCTYLNAGWLRFTGRGVDRELGEGWASGVHADDRAGCLAAYRAAVARREPFEIEYRLRRADGAYRWVLEHGVPRLGPGGGFEGVIGSCIDITDRRRQEEAERLLADIGVVLDGPLALGDRLSDLAAALLPRVADACVVDLFGADGELERAACAHVDVDAQRVLASLPAAAPGSPIDAVARTGDAMLIGDVDERVNRRASRSDADLDMRRDLDTRSAVIAPLVARARRIGVITLSTGRRHSDRLLEQHELRLVERIAERAALAIDNARLFEAELRAAERSAYLARAGEILNSSLELEETLRGLASVAVPALADWCTVHLADPAEGLRRVALAHADPDKVRWASELSDRYPPDPAAPRGVAAVIRTGEPELVASIPEEVLVAAAQDEEHLRLLRELAITSYLSVPLASRGRVHGALSLVTTAESGRLLGEADLRLARELADGAAAAIVNARAYEAQRAIADTLQQALLPGSTPSIPGAEIATEYLAMGDGIEAGGDFYDVFGVDDGRWILVVGDVCGKGPEAASLTALARYTLRALAPAHPGPADLLAGLNEAIRRQRPGNTQFLTACLACVVPGDDGLQVTLACAGHPAPLLLRAAGDCDWVGARGPLVGFLPEIAPREHRFRLDEGDQLVLYTDGVTEARTATGEFLGPGGLRSAVTADRDRTAAALARRIARHVDSWVNRSLTDDVAILVVRAVGADGADGGGQRTSAAGPGGVT